MIDATGIHAGNVIRVDGKVSKVLSSEIRGTGKFGRTVHVRLKSLEDGNLMEKSLRAEEKIEDVGVHEAKMQYLYRDGDKFIFMNNETYEQFPIPAESVGRQDIFLKENAEIGVLFAGEQALAINFPKIVELKVTAAPQGLKGGTETTYKEVELENGLKILAPQFIKEGETVRVDVEGLSYLERVTVRSMKPESGERAKG